MNNTRAKYDPIQFENARREKLARDYMEAKERAKEAKKAEDRYKAELLSLFSGDHETIQAGRYVIIKKTTTSRILDSATLKKELPELWEEYGRDSYKTTLTIG